MPDGNNGREMELVRDLLRWYARSHRPMPWRAKPGTCAPPYHVLVSESMLQQTQVATVVDYFYRFTTALPTVEALADAEERQVLRLWQGLGYYRRARHLHAAARRVVSDHDGRIPRTAGELAALPGVGRYTAGAVASMAFAEPAALVDGNVARVLSRLHEIAEPVDTTAGRKRLWAQAEAWVAMVPTARVRRHRRVLHAGDWNQALMELGATVCTPRQPACGACPVRRHCRARASGRTAELPIVAKRTRQRPVVHQVLAIEREDGRLVFEQRGTAGLWAGMWQMPTLESEKAERSTSPLETLAVRLRLRLSDAERVGEFVHMTTHKRIRFEVWVARWEGGRLLRGTGVWRAADDVDDLPLPRPQQRAVAMLTG